MVAENISTICSINYFCNNSNNLYCLYVYYSSLILGDFAMLLKTGMTVKQALFYNGVSSVLCLGGMIIGIFLGNIETAVNWIFAFTAGMFLYIAWVDMVSNVMVLK